MFDYQPNVQIISPREIGIAANDRVIEIANQLPDYSLSRQKDEQSDDTSWDNGINLFSNL